MNKPRIWKMKLIWDDILSGLELYKQFKVVAEITYQACERQHLKIWSWVPPKPRFLAEKRAKRTKSDKKHDREARVLIYEPPEKVLEYQDIYLKEFKRHLEAFGIDTSDFWEKAGVAPLAEKVEQPPVPIPPAVVPVAAVG